MKVKTLHESISEEEILVTLIFEERDEAGVGRQIIKVIVNSRIPQECVTWPHLGRARKVVLGLRSLFRTLARKTSQTPLEHFLFLKISEILVTQNKSEQNSTKMIATTPTSA
jgi:hypothetical protein